MANEVRLTLAGDASSLSRAFDQADAGAADTERAFSEIEAQARATASAVGSTEDAFAGMARQAGQLGESLDRASGGFSMLSGGIGDVGGAMTAFTDLQGLAEAKALEQEGALLAVEEAQRAYTEAVKEYGEGSLEARAAALALKSAQAEAEPPTAIEEWGEKLELISPIIMGIVGVTDLMILSNAVAQASWIRTGAAMIAARSAMIATSIATGVATAAQWLWNAAMTANPIGLIIVAIAALVAGIVWVATQTDWFGKAWKAIWGGIVAYFTTVIGFYQTAWRVIWSGGEWLINQFKRVPGMLSSAFSAVYGAITAPFRAAFNAVANLWNNTIGRLSWKVPGWVPGVGGNSISAPRLPTMHGGGKVPGAPGQNVFAILQAGETVGAGSAGGGRTVLEIRSGGSMLDQALVQVLVGAVRRAGGLDVVFGEA